MNVGSIFKGHIKEILNLSENISSNRLKVCYSCPLYLNKYGGICNAKLWLNPITGETSTIEKINYKRGCGCRLQAKTRIAEERCPLRKW